MRAIQFHKSLPYEVEPVMNRETLCGLFVDHDREYLPILVHLERIDAHNC